MNATTVAPAGRIGSLHRYPVESLLGETATALDVDQHGVIGDRALALIDRATARWPRPSSPAGDDPCSAAGP